VAGQGRISGGGKTDGPPEDAAENEAAGRAAAEHGGEIRHNQDKLQIARRRREANGPSLHIADLHTEQWSPALETLRSPPVAARSVWAPRPPGTI
jgi:hypothetical protein